MVEADDEKKPRIPLLTPYMLGEFKLSHRIVFPALTRCRSWGNVPQPHEILYYSQRATHGGLLISEATTIAPNAFGHQNVPGIWSKEQVDAWKPIVKAVHDKGAIFFCQIWHAGRVTPNGIQHHGQPVSSSDKQLPPIDPLGDGNIKEYPQPCRLKVHEIPQFINLYRIAARNAIEAGFDGVQIHGGHGYLIDQFLKDSINDRTDEYGGSMENRCRFAMEVLEAVIEEVGAHRVSMKLSPHYSYLHCRDSDAEGLGIYMAEKLSKYKILFCEMTEHVVPTGKGTYGFTRGLHQMRKVYDGTFMVFGCDSREEGNKAIAEGYADLVGYTNMFIANPDLPKRFEANAPLNDCNWSTLYISDPVVGYTDYPFLEDTIQGGC